MKTDSFWALLWITEMDRTEGWWGGDTFGWNLWDQYFCFPWTNYLWGRTGSNFRRQIIKDSRALATNPLISGTTAEPEYEEKPLVFIALLNLTLRCNLQTVLTDSCSACIKKKKKNLIHSVIESDCLLADIHAEMHCVWLAASVVLAWSGKRRSHGAFYVNITLVRRAE